ncbi:MAG: acylphosphatase [Bacteroidales bacterium]|nr:acylphosphatase [Bacteroidales bacterium]
MSVIRVLITVTGRVQGVGYRHAALQQARSLGVTGFVRNLQDGTVYMEAQGNPDAVSCFIEWCKSGAPRASVELVEYSYHPLRDFETFQIR